MRLTAGAGDDTSRVVWFDVSLNQIRQEDRGVFAELEMVFNHPGWDQNFPNEPLYRDAQKDPVYVIGHGSTAEAAINNGLECCAAAAQFAIMVDPNHLTFKCDDDNIKIGA